MSCTPPSEVAAGVELPPQAVSVRAPAARIAAALAANFAEALGDRRFTAALWHSVAFAIVSVPLELGLGLSAGGLSSLAIDDFKAAFADGGASTGMTLTPHAAAAVRTQFGRGDMHVLETNG